MSKEYGDLYIHDDKSWRMEPGEVMKLGDAGFSSEEISEINNQYISWEESLLNNQQQPKAEDDILIIGEEKKMTVAELNDKFIKLTNKLIDQQLSSGPIDNSRLEIIAKNMQIINSMKHSNCSNGCNHKHDKAAKNTDATELYFIK